MSQNVPLDGEPVVAFTPFGEFYGDLTELRTRDNAVTLEQNGSHAVVGPRVTFKIAGRHVNRIKVR